MVALYVSSVGSHTGKTLITMGLIDRLKRDGFKVGYFKPVGHYPVMENDLLTDKTAWLFCRLFELDDPIELVCPVILTRDLMTENYGKDIEGLQDKIINAFNEISREKDVVIVGCDHNLGEGGSVGASGIELVKALNARLLLVERYAPDVCVDFPLALKKIIGDPMLGVLFNRVDPLHLEEVKTVVSPFLNRRGMNVFGSLTTDKLLAAKEVRYLAQHLGADIVAGKDKLDELVESFLVGGMQVNQFITYLLKRPGSGIIVGGDRTDIQLVAIENEVQCLILSGNLYPNDTIVDRAEAKGVPILVAKDDTYTVAQRIEAMVGHFSLEKRKKIARGIKFVDQGFDFENLYGKLKL